MATAKKKAPAKKAAPAKKVVSQKPKNTDDPFGPSVSNNKFSPAFSMQAEQAKLDRAERDMAKRLGGVRGKIVKEPTYVTIKPTKNTPTMTVRSGTRSVVKPITDQFGNKIAYKAPRPAGGGGRGNSGGSIGSSLRGMFGGGLRKGSK